MTCLIKSVKSTRSAQLIISFLQMSGDVDGTEDLETAEVDPIAVPNLTKGTYFISKCVS